MLVAHCALSLMVVVTSGHMEELSCVSMVVGGPSVLTFGMTQMLVWCADSWNTPLMVGFQYVMQNGGK